VRESPGARARALYCRESGVTAIREWTTLPFPEIPPSSAGAWTALVVGVVALLVILVFILQNLQSVQVCFLTFHYHLPLAIALLFAVILGAVIVLAFGGGRIMQDPHVAVLGDLPLEHPAAGGDREKFPLSTRRSGSLGCTAM
jgi:uncharacterized integral membrane protein